MSQFYNGFHTRGASGVFTGTAAEDSVSVGATGISVQRGNGAGLFLTKATGYVSSTLAQFTVDNSIVGTITTTGTTTAYNVSSDYRLKCNWRPIDKPVDLLMRIKPYEGEFKAAPGVRVHYCIAHELQDVLPQAVTGDKDGEEMQQVDYSKLVPMLVASLQDAHKRIDALEARLGDMT
jgi:hypothetical protein